MHERYAIVAGVFTHIVSQMSGDEVLGFSLPVETRYISDAKEMPQIPNA